MDKLFPYQLDGAQFLAQKCRALLADEMGLGKTVMAIRGLDSIRALKVLIVCPSIARINWQRELEHWSETKRQYKVLETLSDTVAPNESAICTFTYATENAKTLGKTKWDCLIIDEAHFVKDPKTKRAKALLGTEGLIRSSDRTWLMTGTPAPNHAGELWIMLYTFGVTKLKYNDFVARFCHVRETSYGYKVTGTNHDRIPELKQLLSKIMLRRLKKDVMTQLPPITYGHVVVPPGEFELDLQASFTQYFFPTDERAALFDKLNAEDKLLNDVIQNMHSTKGEEMLTAINSLQSSVATLRRFNGLQKVKSAAELIAKELENNAYKKVVVFAIHRDVIENMRIALRKFGPVVLYGGQPLEKRQKNVDRFQKNPKCRVFIGNIQAAGTAVTLTSAHHVVFVEQDWVPANNAQAVMRCHRIGQENPVSVRFIGLADSIDTHIMFILKKKTRDLTLIFDENLLQPEFSQGSNSEGI